ncbi:uncharacterized protein [Musca autumnalis]|uniref:uncharacterized protein n=1 Tax=Musca autumnalis TaxID=221902 RepID=UPI003CE9568F
MCTTYPGADIPSDHNLLVSKLRLKLSLTRKKKSQPRIDIGKLTDPIIRDELQHQINTELGNINEDNLDLLWNNLKTIINTVTKSTLGNRSMARTEDWITVEILELWEERRSPITRLELERAIQTLKDKKATGPDEIPSEVLKLIDTSNIELLITLFNHVYDTGQYPADWLKSTFIAIPKKNCAKRCCEFRLISLMSHKFLIAFAFIAAAAATHISNEYLPPNVAVESYQVEESAPAHTFSDTDGYRYKTLRRRVVRRQRRDVSNEYLPPIAVSESVPEYVNTAPTETFETVEAAPAHTFSQADGYRYKTQRRRVVRRQRRDVSHLPSNEYLPPAEETHVVEAAAAPVEQVVEEAAPAHELAADGYRYKTHRRVVYRRNRRDVSHLPSNEYLPPAEETHFVEAAAAPVEQVVEEAAPAHELAADGYRYKTHRRVVYRRNRRDVSHLPSNEYLPPAEETHFVEAAAAPVEQVVEEAAPAHELTADGYRYKTHRRVVYRRNRRDVSHLPSNEYLPPQQIVPVAAPSNEYLPPVQADAEPAHELTADGYRYKTHRRRVVRRN